MSGTHGTGVGVGFAVCLPTRSTHKPSQALSSEPGIAGTPMQQQRTGRQQRSAAAAPRGSSAPQRIRATSRAPQAQGEGRELREGGELGHVSARHNIHVQGLERGELGQQAQPAPPGLRGQHQPRDSLLGAPRGAGA